MEGPVVSRLHHHTSRHPLSRVPRRRGYPWTSTSRGPDRTRHRGTRRHESQRSVTTTSRRLLRESMVLTNRVTSKVCTGLRSERSPRPCESNVDPSPYHAPSAGRTSSPRLPVAPVSKGRSPSGVTTPGEGPPVRVWERCVPSTTRAPQTTDTDVTENSCPPASHPRR